MANRPIFIPNTKGTKPLFQEIGIEFKWHSGFAVIQKKRSIQELHNNAKQQNIYPVLEASTKSDIKLGQRLSAFNLQIQTPQFGKISIESAFQGSKVFEGNIQFTDIYTKSSLDAKRDKRLKESGKIIGFNFFGEKWKTEPKTAFYDWLYLKALSPYKDYLLRNLTKYQGFTDIEFNPKKSFSCQARSSAILVAMLKLDILEDSLSSQQKFIENTYSNQDNYLQSLFD